MSRDARFDAEAAALGHGFDGEIVVGGRYVPLVRDGELLYVSGQIPRVGTTIVCTGAAGDTVGLAQAQDAAKVCALRALAILRRELGSLDKVGALLRLNVFVRSAPGFTQQSEVGDGASELLLRVLGDAGRHVRTSIGVLQLPKGATVELDLIARAG